MSEWNEQLNVNLSSPYFLIKAILPRMPKNSAIVNVSSLSGIRSMPKFPGLSVYCAAKAGLVGLTEALAPELKSKGIRINAIAPGAVNTEMLQNAFPEYQSETNPIDIAYPIVNLLNPITSHKVTGTIMEVLL